MLETARGFALDNLGRRKEAIKSYRSAFSGIYPLRDQLPVVYLLPWSVSTHFQRS
jgi:hypothetical protein